MALTEALVAASVLAVTAVSVVKTTHVFTAAQRDSIVSQLAQFQVRNYIENFGSDQFDECENISLSGPGFGQARTTAEDPSQEPPADDDPIGFAGSTTSSSAGPDVPETNTSASTSTGASGDGDFSQPPTSDATAKIPTSGFSLNCATAMVNATVGGKMLNDVALPKTANVEVVELNANWSIGLSEKSQ